MDLSSGEDLSNSSNAHDTALHYGTLCSEEDCFYRVFMRLTSSWEYLDACLDESDDLQLWIEAYLPQSKANALLKGLSFLYWAI